MTALPSLSGWDVSRDALHRASQVLAAFQKAFSPALPNALHLSLLPTYSGVHTRPLTFGALAFDFAAGEVRCKVGDNDTSFSLTGHSPHTLHAALIDHLSAAGINGTEAVKPSDDDALLVLDTHIGAAYATALWGIYTSIARVRGAWMGSVTPMVVWPHGFDLSTLYFPGQIPDEHAQPHINFGFSPGSAGFARPYVYAYASPMPDDAMTTPLPAPARWTTDGWTGVVIDYDTLRAESQPDEVLESTLKAMFEMMAAWL